MVDKPQRVIVEDSTSVHLPDKDDVERDLERLKNRATDLQVSLAKVNASIQTLERLIGILS